MNPGIMNDERYKAMMIDGGPMWSKVFKRRVLFRDESVNKDCKVFPESLYYVEDNAVATSIKLQIKRFVYIPQPMYFYLMRPSSLTHTVSERHIESRWRSCHMILEIAQKEGNLQKYPVEFEFIFSVLFSVNTTNYLMPYIFQGKRELFKNIIEEQKRIFPNFQNNPYYQKRVDPHARGLIRLLMEIL